MNPLLIVTAFCQNDAALTKKLYKWIAELSVHPVGDYSCLLIADSAVSPEMQKEIVVEAKKSFGVVSKLVVTTTAKHAPNGMFLDAARWISQCGKLPWLWLEPDCVPLTSDWLSELSEEYYTSPMRYMGPIIRQEGQEGLPAAHLTGCSIYPHDAYLDYQKMEERLMNENVAWDIESASAIVPRSKHTKLIHHFWGTPEMPPVFVLERKPDDPKNFVTPNFVSNDAVMFHRSKDGRLIDLLTEGRAKSKSVDPRLQHVIESLKGENTPQQEAKPIIPKKPRATVAPVPAATTE